MARISPFMWLLVLCLPVVTMFADAASKLAVSTTSFSLAPGQAASLTVSGASGDIRVSSSDNKVAAARVDDGVVVVTAKAAGRVRLTVRDRKSKVTVSVTVSAPAITVTPRTLSLSPGTDGVATVENARGKVKVSIADTRVATAKLSGGRLTVTAKAVGTTRITLRDSQYAAVLDVTVATAAPPPSADGSYTLLAWNDLGMHCMDGDYSVFSILPPFNNLHAQLIDKSNGGIVTQGVTMTYEAMADADGSINSTSSSKSNFWQFVREIFGVELTPDTGLTGNMTPSATPRPMSFDAANRLFKADGLPITPYDDALVKNPYPMVRVVARDAGGNALAQARVVLPVSDEMSCSNCHAASSGAATRPRNGWIVDANKEAEWKKNILALHDEKQAANARYPAALTAVGYQPAGLLATASSGRPVLCASCHASKALEAAGVTGVKPLTEAIHGHHGQVRDPATGTPLDGIGNRGACYQCHPGSETKCLRGAMGNAVDAAGKATMDCQACHGGMSHVGRPGRAGWLEQPNCQACHHDGQRETSAVDAGGLLKSWLDERYATRPDTPAAGLSLYRFSSGHGGLQCESCHGATHAEYPSSHRNDNVLSQDVQGHAGSIGECAACHKTVPVTASGGPHGMHTIGSTWVSKHESYAEKDRNACAYCHGADFRGSPLARVKVAKSFRAEGRTVSYQAGQQVTCYDCHDGPSGD